MPDWRQFQKQFGGIQGSELTEDSAGDLEILTSSIRARLLELQSIQMWRKDPDLYTSVLSDSIFVIMRRNFAPPDERLRSLVARELQVPKVLEAARQNLQNPPKVYTEVALQQLPDTIKFFQKDVPEAFREVKDPELLARFKRSNDAVVEGFENISKPFCRTTCCPPPTAIFVWAPITSARSCSMTRWWIFRSIAC